MQTKSRFLTMCCSSSFRDFYYSTKVSNPQEEKHPDKLIISSNHIFSSFSVSKLVRVNAFHSVI